MGKPNVRTILIGLGMCCAMTGCAMPRSHKHLVTAERFDEGLVLILPGIEGAGLLSYSVQEGLDEAGVDYAMPVYQWGSRIPLAGPLMNQMNSKRARAAAWHVAKLIARYRKRHPGKPIHLIGHSGGGAVAVFALEQLPPHMAIDGAILLSPSLSTGYDLGPALRRTKKGIAHFYSEGDIALLVVGTTVFGTIDRVHGPSAGARGFANPRVEPDLLAKLHQTRWTPAMAGTGNLGGHLGTTSPGFVNTWVSDWITCTAWPPPVATLASTGPQ